MTTPAPPTLKLPGAFSVPSVAPVYVDGIPVKQGSPGASALPPGGVQPAQGFWSTQPRPAGDPHAEQLIISLAQPRLISYLSLDLAHFPHTATLWFWDGDAWSPLARMNGTPLEIIVTGSVPAVVDNPAALAAGQNPYHYGNGHWLHHAEPVVPVTTTRLLVWLARPGQGSGVQRFPVSPQGKYVPYPLGIRNLDFGMRLISCDDAPRTLRDPGALSLRQPFATSTDVKGSPVQVAIRENRACDLLRRQSVNAGSS